MQRLGTTRKLEPGSSPAAYAPSRRLALGRYWLERRIGSGGHGSVWQAFDEKLERDVAVKVIPHDDGPTRPRAEREARVAARLNHPGIVGLYELGHDEDAIYLVSELVRGRTLAELERAGALSDGDVARIGVALCEALAHAHRSGVVHRDVKPQNVIVIAEPAAGAGFAKLTDFGVAHVASEDPLTRTGQVVGTLAYMAPEQADGAPVTAATDVFALALVLYEGLTGVSAGRRAVGGGVRARIGRLRRDLPRELCSSIDGALDPAPERRPSLAELERSLRRAVGGLSDGGGLVEPGTLERLGLSSGDREHVTRGARRPLLVPSPLLGRLAAGLAAAGLALVALERLGPVPPLAPLAAAAAVAVAVALLPRIGWLAAAASICVWLASPAADQQGTAIVLAAALAPIPLLMPRAGELWSAPALAPLLGAAGVAPLFVALAGLASTAWRRAGLAAAGLLWLVAMELVAGRALLFGPTDGSAPLASWHDSMVGASADALYPTLSSPALVPAAAWALLAAVLPLLVRGRAPLLDLIGAAIWATGLVLALGGLADVLAGSAPLGEARGALAGAALGAAVAVVCARLRPSERRVRAPTLP